MLCQKILKIKFPRLAKNAFAIQHLLHHSISYIFIHYNCTINYYKMNHFALKLFQQLVKKIFSTKVAHCNFQESIVNVSNKFRLHVMQSEETGLFGIL